MAFLSCHLRLRRREDCANNDITVSELAVNADKTPKRRRLNLDAKRALAAETIRRFAKQYSRKAQKGVEPNDRCYERDVERRVKRMPPEALDAVLNDDDV